MNMHEGVTEDGVLSTCGICGCEVYMLDPEEMDWICDPCSMDGWSGIQSAWKLIPGDQIRVGRRTAVVLSTEDFGKQVWLECRDENGENFAVIRRNAQKVYIHSDRVEL